MAKSSSRHILVVNDTEEIIALFREILEGLGHRMTGTSFAPDDLSEVVKVDPDLVIIDLMFGGEDVGWQLLQKMRMSPATEKIPVIVCTAASQHVREQEGWLTANAVKVVLKPFSVTDMEQAITKAFELAGSVA